MKLLKEILYAICLLGLALVLGELAVLLHRSGALVLRAESTALELEATARTVREYSQEQIAHLRDPKQQKAIDAAIQTAAVFNASGRLINTQVIPRAMKTLDSVNETIRTLNTAAESVNSLVVHTDDQVNGVILPGVDGAIQETVTAIADLQESLKTAATGSKIILDDIHRLTSDPSIGQAMAQVAEASKSLSVMADRVAEASKQAPAIAADLEKISRTSSKYSKWVLIASIIGTLARAFF